MAYDDDDDDGRWEVWSRFGNTGQKLDCAFDRHWNGVVGYYLWNTFLESFPGHWESLKKIFPEVELL